MRIFIFTLLIMFTQVSVKAQEIPQINQSYGGTLIWGTHTQPTLINPIFTTYSVSMPLLELVFNSLVRLNPKGEIEPDLAESWDISSDGLVYTFHLRQGVKFHNGKQCTADDVKFTYYKLLDPQVDSPFRSSLQLVQECKVIDKYTFQIILKKPSAPFIYRLTREIVPRHLLDKAELKTCYFNFHPVGTGPFRFQEWTEDNRIILEYNPDYYEGRPYLDKIVIKTYATSRDVWTALMRGEADFVLFIEREDYEVVKDDPAFRAYAFPADYYYALVYNLEDSILADRRVREAIAYGVDRKNLIERVAGGYGLECSGPFYPGSLGYNPQVQPFEYNPEKAQELLSQAEWKDRNNDGILEREGEELKINVLVDARNEVYKKIIMVIRQQLQEVGVKIRVILYSDDSELSKELLQQNKPQAQLKLLLAGVDPDQTRGDWCSKEMERFGSLWVYGDEGLERLFNIGEITQNRAQRKLIYRKIHNHIYQDQLACFLYHPFVFHAIVSKFENMDGFFNLNMPHYTMKDWHIRRKERR